jgi:3-hydroxyisobutyrate dehydrogenase-like beta-hydroxyacid dehydrogenase
VAVKSVGILSPGEMGSALAKSLLKNDMPVATSLAGRSDLTKLRAEETGIRDAGSIDALVAECDVLLSVLTPSEAVSVAKEVAGSMRRTGSRPIFADCNAIAPQTVKAMSGEFTDMGAVFVDAGIAGRRIYCSGPNTEAFESLRDYGLDITCVGPVIGQASGLKMLHSTTTKGTRAMWLELLLAARIMGLSDALAEEFAAGGIMVKPELIEFISHEPKRARRMVGELEEAALTYEGLGLTPHMLHGAADMHRLISETPLADQSPREKDPPVDTILAILQEHLAVGEQQAEGAAARG